MRRSTILLVVAAALTFAASSTAASTSTLHRREIRQTRTIRSDLGTLRFFRHHRWLLRARRTRVDARRALRFARAEIAWTRRELRETRAALRPARPALDAGLVAALTCIHGGEGAWNANTGNGYYGGLQMDLGFQSTYGPEFLRRWGTADRWPVWAQLVAAIRAIRSGRGFGPWPNTAAACGLL